MSYNTAFTSLPIIVLGVLDKDFNVEFLLKYPQLFWRGISNYEFNAKIFGKWLFSGLIHGLLIFFLLIYGIKCESELDFYI